MNTDPFYIADLVDEIITSVDEYKTCPPISTIDKLVLIIDNGRIPDGDVCHLHGLRNTFIYERQKYEQFFGLRSLIDKVIGWEVPKT